ncbi:MFS transporter [Sulfolobus sp. S-194]|uniref:MFS transporter n=1 Tax=Sulfolobus sp. S-194 TaxID=2512240 RepID=UPI001437091F|nr:MFS transporter [Sulfolobus sp. S-194]QIW23597.1 MFS transporter [Sulfolobus sp. S-194]
MNKLSRSVLFSSLPSFISSLEATMILMAIPLIAKDFSITYVKASTLLAFYVVTEVLLSIPSSLLAERIGVRKTMTVGTIIMGLSSLLIVLFNSFTFILVLRILQGIGASMVLLTSLSYASLIGSDEERGKMIGLNHTIVSLGYVLGLPLGGLVAEINWKYLFILTSVFSFASLYLLSTLKEMRAKSGIGINVIYASLIFDGVILGLYYSPFFVLSILGLIVTIRKIELGKGFYLSSLSGFLHSITRNMIAAFFVFYLYSLHLSTLEIGSLVLLYPLSFTLISFYAGKLHDKYKLRVAAFGFASMALSSLSLFFNVVLGEFLLGASSGIATTSNTAYTMSSVKSKDRIIASGIRSVQGVVSNTIGLTIASYFEMSLTPYVEITILLNLASLLILNYCSILVG